MNNLVTSSSVQVFEYFYFFNIRTVTIDGEAWFVAKDVAEALAYVWNGLARIEHVPEEWRGVTSVVTPGGVQQMSVLSEQGLYFFIGRSDKPAALPFQKWLAGEVIPSIRKTGRYEMPMALPDFTNPAEAARAWADEYEGRLAAEGRVRALTQQVETMEPMADLGRAIASVDVMTLRDWIHLMKDGTIKEKKVHDWLVENGFLYRDAVSGRLCVRSEHDRLFRTDVERINGQWRVFVKITGDGIAKLTDRIKAYFARA